MPYTIKPMERAEVGEWRSWMKQIKESLDDPTLFVVDPAEYVAGHMENGGFGLKIVGEDREKIACLICCVPQTREENLGSELFSDLEELNRVIHVEYAAVAPEHRGNRLQETLIAEAERRMTGTRFAHLMATASPDNPASVHSFLRQGYRILATKPMYGGHLRHIFYKPLGQIREELR